MGQRRCCFALHLPQATHESLQIAERMRGNSCCRLACSSNSSCCAFVSQEGCSGSPAPASAAGFSARHRFCACATSLTMHNTASSGICSVPGFYSCPSQIRGKQSL